MLYELPPLYGSYPNPTLHIHAFSKPDDYAGPPGFLFVEASLQNRLPFPSGYPPLAHLSDYTLRQLNGFVQFHQTGAGVFKTILTFRNFCVDP